MNDDESRSCSAYSSRVTPLHLMLDGGKHQSVLTHDTISMSDLPAVVDWRERGYDGDLFYVTDRKD